MKKIKTINEIKEFAQNNDAEAFEKYCTENGIFVEWLDVTITNLNEEYYNIYLPNYAVGVMYYNGKLEEFNINYFLISGTLLGYELEMELNNKQ